MRHMRKLNCLFLCLGLSTSAMAFDGLAILGDSSSTAAGTHPRLQFDAKVLWDAFNGTLDLSVKKSMLPEDFRSLVEENPTSPTRVGPSSRENDGGSGWIWHNVTQRISAQTIEAHSLSYGYLVGRKLGLAPVDILIAGENGTTARHAWLHAARLVGARNKDLPSRVVFFYTGNDLCAQTYDDITEAEDYGEELLKGLKYLVLNGHSAVQGTKIYIPGYLPVTSLLHDPTILAKKIQLHGEEVTCKEARDRLFAPKNPPVITKEESMDPRFAAFSAVMPPSPVLFCPTLFSKSAEDSARQSMMANRIRAYRDIQRKTVDEFNRWRGEKFPARSFEAAYVEATESIKFEGDDVAGDCFHLSPMGQGKIARALLTGMQSK